MNKPERCSVCPNSDKSKITNILKCVATKAWFCLECGSLIGNTQYLGETPVDISTTKYKNWCKEDWTLLWIERWSGIDGSHHKDWLIDQIARINKGTPIILKIAKWSNNRKEERFSLGEPTKEYWAWVDEMKNVEDGPDTYDYDFGIAP